MTLILSSQEIKALCINHIESKFNKRVKDNTTYLHFHPDVGDIGYKEYGGFHIEVDLDNDIVVRENKNERNIDPNL